MWRVIGPVIASALAIIVGFIARPAWDPNEQPRS
jgi:hypothetical protein